jgi:DNA-binding MarR family transcriptional regulator
VNGITQSNQNNIDFGILLTLAFGVFKAELHEHLEQSGYSDAAPTFGYVFRILDAGAISLRELAGHLQMTPQGAHKVIEDMAAKNYVRREADPDDARITRLHLTKRGKNALAQARRFHAAFETKLGKRLGVNRVATTRAVLEQILSENGQAESELGLRAF